MGTNYEAVTEQCPCCKRSTKVHIGKKSYGWEFSFRGYKAYNDYELLPILSWQDWKDFILSEQCLHIIDEYGNEIAVNDFIELVEDSRRSIFINKVLKKPLNHYDYCTEHYYLNENNFKDPDGWSFYTQEFS